VEGVDGGQDAVEYFMDEECPALGTSLPWAAFWKDCVSSTRDLPTTAPTPCKRGALVTFGHSLSNTEFAAPSAKPQ
jgi:hypothetical protein